MIRSHSFALLLVLGLAVDAAAEPMTLRGAERLALQRNFALQSGSETLRAANAAARGAYGLYDPQTLFTLAHGEGRDLLNQTPTVQRLATRYSIADLSLLQALPSGASLNLTFDTQRQESLRGGSGFYDPSWTSSLRLGVVQPLLNGFGPSITEEPIILAARSRDATTAGLQQQAVELLVTVHNRYVEILRSRQLIIFRETSVILAWNLLEETRARVAVGVLPPLDLLDAEFGLKRRERDLLDERQRYRELVDQMAVLLAVRDELEIAAEEIPQPQVTVDAELDLRDALALRPDLQQARQLLAGQQLLADNAGNRALPGLDLSASYGRNGLGGSYSDDLESVANDDLDNWEVGLTFSYPLGNRVAEGEKLRRRHELESARRALQQQEEEVRREVRSASQRLEVGLLRLDVTRKGLEVADERLKNLLKRREVGLATTFDVLEGEAFKAQAQADLVGDQSAYAQNVVDYLRATGRLLAAAGVQLADAATATAPSLLRLDTTP
ncbi:MAG: hypothetical protein A2091_02925 [Desulfuromonadales bacterium GWD2_61_12]|nr:MAG: hypothetical protein A2005_05870 [Desulfuromonadales bacterium GWC2_61_20]OGR33206.1 MAG: hypothetical protein A2091_02925 [Desulfuromonadales bacterium GWD2_61_12]HBT83205.1 hypothetical protein [Desulfuromonas sp.]